MALKLYRCQRLSFLPSTFQEMLDIMKSIYDMMGKYTYPTMQDDAPREHVESFFQVQPTHTILISPRTASVPNCRGTTEGVILLRRSVDVVRLRVIHQRLTDIFLLFQKMDRNKDGVVTVEEFIESCKKVRPDFKVEQDWFHRFSRLYFRDF